MTQYEINQYRDHQNRVIREVGELLDKAVYQYDHPLPEAMFQAIEILKKAYEKEKAFQAVQCEMMDEVAKDLDTFATKR